MARSYLSQCRAEAKQRSRRIDLETEDRIRVSTPGGRYSPIVKRHEHLVAAVAREHRRSVENVAVPRDELRPLACSITLSERQGIALATHRAALRAWEEGRFDDAEALEERAARLEQDM